MKKIIVIWSSLRLCLLQTVLLLFALIKSEAQIVTIPDPNFVIYLQTNFPSAMSGNQMNTTDASILSATSVDITGLGISDLTGIQYFTSLTFLECLTNNLSTLPPLPSGIVDLSIANNLFTTLPNLPANLISLECSGNSIAQISSLPPTLQSLVASFNQLSLIASLPSALGNLTLMSNPNLTLLPALPSSLGWLDVQQCALFGLPSLPSTLGYLTCNNNNISCLPVLPNGLQQLIATGNTVNCLPNIPTNGSFTSDIGTTVCNSLALATVTNVTCFGTCNGHATANATAGTTYDYNWSNGFADLNNSTGTSTATGLCAGNYFVNVQESGGGGCASQVSFTITEPPPLSIMTPSTITLCQGTDLCVAVVGGTPPYSYLWSTGSTSACLVSASSGTYSVTITDANACSVNGMFNLNYFPPMTLNLPSTIVDCDNLTPTCVTVTGGTQPYLYIWSDAQTDSCHYFLNAGIYTITVTDVSGCTNTASTIVDGGTPVFVSLTLVAPSSCGMCDGIINLSYGGGIGPYTQTWVPFPPPNLNALCENDFFEVDNIDQHACVGTLAFTMPLACPAVWPGDANYDGTANNLDLLPIGIGYGTTGPVRTNASIIWVAQPAVDWSDSLVAGTNYKHIDCNGDGTINDADTTAITKNYGQTHPLRLLSPSQNPLDPYLYFDIVVDTVGTSQQLDVPLMFGTSALIADSIYGLAFTVNYDTALVKADSVEISFSPSWIGTTGIDMITIQHNDPLNGKLYVGMTRIDQNNISGFGQIAKVTVVTVDNVSGRIASTSIFDTLTFSLSDVTVIDKDENIRNVNIGGDSLIIQDSTTNIYEIISPENIKIYPNPAKDKLFIKLPNQLLVSEISISNVIGEKMGSEFNSRNNLIEIRSLKNYSNGIYFLKIKTERGTVVKKFSVIK